MPPVFVRSSGGSDPTAAAGMDCVVTTLVLLFSSRSDELGIDRLRREAVRRLSESNGPGPESAAPGLSAVPGGPVAAAIPAMPTSVPSGGPAPAPCSDSEMLDTLMPVARLARLESAVSPRFTRDTFPSARASGDAMGSAGAASRSRFAPLLLGVMSSGLWPSRPTDDRASLLPITSRSASLLLRGAPHPPRPIAEPRRKPEGGAMSPRRAGKASACIARVEGESERGVPLGESPADARLSFCAAALDMLLDEPAE